MQFLVTTTHFAPYSYLLLLRSVIRITHTSHVSQHWALVQLDGKEMKCVRLLECWIASSNSTMKQNSAGVISTYRMCIVYMPDIVAIILVSLNLKTDNNHLIMRFWWDSAYFDNKALIDYSYLSSALDTAHSIVRIIDLRMKTYRYNDNNYNGGIDRITMETQYQSTPNTEELI